MLNVNEPIDVEGMAKAIGEAAERAMSHIHADAAQLIGEVRAAAEAAEAIRKDATQIWNDATVLLVRDGEIHHYDEGRHGEPLIITHCGIDINCGRAVGIGLDTVCPGIKVKPGRYRMVIALLPLA